jgi:hypothetical protein
MRYDEPQLCAGLVDFSEPTLLIIGDASAFTELANHILKRQEVHLPKSNCIDIALSIVPTESPSRLQRTGNEFILNISATDAAMFADLIAGLVNSHAPAHTYLDFPGEIAVMISKGEYDPKKVFSGDTV